jgi:hypothetical protein
VMVTIHSASLVIGEIRQTHRSVCSTRIALSEFCFLIIMLQGTNRETS